MSSESVVSRFPAKVVYLGGFAVVALSTVALPSVTGYGTVLSQLVVLGAWALLAAVTSGAFADQNHVFLWPIAAILNVVIFAVPGSVVFWLLRRRAPQLCIVILGGWLIFYIASLFLLFPATDGP
jgi:hypothetical protein